MSSTRAIAEGLEPQNVTLRHILHRSKAANQVFSYLHYFLFHSDIPSFFPKVAKENNNNNNTSN